MKCLETEKLIGYVYQLLDESAVWRVRAHLEECPRCREIVEQHLRLGRVLDEWKAPESTPAFDARVRQAVDEYAEQRASRTFWQSIWGRGMVLASLGVLMVAGVIAHFHIHGSVSNSSTVAATQPQTTSGASRSAKIAGMHDPAASARAGLAPAPVAPEASPAAGQAAEDNDTQALEDYDLAANFDVLSELRKGEPQVAN
jgi:predicted anti-sigma-YlaC factor YlaD